jgi:hypothetical protein
MPTELGPKGSVRAYMILALQVIHRVRGATVLRGNPYLTREFERNINMASWRAHELRGSRAEGVGFEPTREQ